MQQTISHLVDTKSFFKSKHASFGGAPYAAPDPSQPFHFSVEVKSVVLLDKSNLARKIRNSFSKQLEQVPDKMCTFEILLTAALPNSKKVVELLNTNLNIDTNTKDLLADFNNLKRVRLFIFVTHVHLQK